MRYTDVLGNQPYALIQKIDNLHAKNYETENLKRLIEFVRDAKTPNEIRSYIIANACNGQSQAVKKAGAIGTLQLSMALSVSTLACLLGNDLSAESLGWSAIAGLLVLLVSHKIPENQLDIVLVDVSIYVCTRVMLLNQGFILLTGPVRSDYLLMLPFFNERNVSLPATVFGTGTIDDQLTELFSFGFGVGPLGSRDYNDYVGVVINTHSRCDVFHSSSENDRLDCTINRTNNYHTQFGSLRHLSYDRFVLSYNDDIDKGKLMRLQFLLGELRSAYHGFVVECTDSGVLLVAVRGKFVVGHNTKSTITLSDDVLGGREAFFELVEGLVKIVTHKQ